MAASVSNVFSFGYQTAQDNLSEYNFLAYPQPLAALVSNQPVTNYGQSLPAAFVQPRFNINPHVIPSLPNFFAQKQPFPVVQSTFGQHLDNYNYPSLSLLNGYQSQRQPNVPASGCFTHNSGETGVVARKHGEHPFTWRRRTTAPPAEGMTRTRDKYRVVYTEKQRVGLEKEFKSNKFITTKIRTRISKDLNLSERQIKIWFQNRRAKERRQPKTPATGQDEYDDATSNELTSPKQTNQSQYRSSCRYSKAPLTVSKEDKTFDRSYIGQNNKDAELIHRKSDCQYPVSPSEWNNSPMNVIMPQLNISPFSSNMEACFLSRS